MTTSVHSGCRPYALLAELTYRCPLHCPYCSNPVQTRGGEELSLSEWTDVFHQAESLGVLHVGLSGGEPLARPDLDDIIRAARSAGLYTNLITSGVGLDEARASSLKKAGLQSIQLSLQAHEEVLANAIAGAKVYRHKLTAANAIREAGLAFSMNIVVHRANIAYLEAMIDLAASLGAERLEVANVQYYGWAFLNRHRLLPTQEQVQAARVIAEVAIQKHQGRMAILYVLPDLYESRPKPCMQGWGQRYMTVRPNGDVLPCPTAGSIPDLKLESIREHTLSWIWHESPTFNRFRGTDWMPEPCQTCEIKTVDHGGCRCQAALLTGDANQPDPVCTRSPHRDRVNRLLDPAQADNSPWLKRKTPMAIARVI
jgi:pyrroloquinoline quinone biosynthesis protein E